MSEQLRFSPDQNASDLMQFMGTENHYRNPSAAGIVYTDGVKHMSETRGAYWLLSLIAQRMKSVKALQQEPFITIEMIVQDSSAMIIYTDGNSNVLHTESIEYTDFSDDGVCLWLIDGVLILPSEY
jgi:hypothetical protein